MKYLRTKTNIFEVLGHTNNCTIVKAKHKRNVKYSISRSMIEGWSDTIEDLLDEIVFICGDDVSVDYKLLTPEQYEKYYKGEGCCCKGAIWTDKGLIFVSEMNNETGEMELL